jgi:Domain of unknown function (DUF3598)
MKSQWDCFLQNLGEWRGSFTLLSPQGEVQSDTPSCLRLEYGDDSQQMVRLTLQRTGTPDIVLQFTSVGGGGLQFFETGSFSQGAMQFSPVGTFGAELALKWGDRRLRLVPLFQDRRFDRVTLIRECRAGSDRPERPPLTVADLLGEWQGEAITIYPDLRAPDRYATHLTVSQVGDRLSQQLTFGAGPASQSFTSTAQIDGSMLRFDQGALPLQILLLADGASVNCPLEIKSGHPFFLESGWLIQPDQRQRLIRSYNDNGEWVSLTLVTEQKG